MSMPPDATALRAAWEAMRRRRCLRHWPQDFDAVMADPVRSRLVQIEARARVTPRPGAPIRPQPCPTPLPAPRPAQGALLDRKRAAAGERDDD